MRLRHPDGFTPERFEQFCAQCRVFRAYVEASLAEATILKCGAGSYVFFEPELSEDRSTASLPLGGWGTLGSRHEFQNASSWMLWHHFPLAFLAQLEEGLTENIGNGSQTNWWPPAQAIWFAHAKVR